MEEEEEERERKQCTERVVSKGLPGAPAIPLNEHIWKWVFSGTVGLLLLWSQLPLAAQGCAPCCIESNFNIYIAAFFPFFGGGGSDLLLVLSNQTKSDLSHYWAVWRDFET